MRTVLASLAGFSIPLLAVAMGAGQDTHAQESPAQRRGRADYVELGCYQCHGYEGQGGGTAGPRIAPDTQPFARFIRLVRTPPNVMPAYSPAVLNDAQLRRIYEYVASIPAPPDVESLPALAGLQQLVAVVVS